MSEPTPLGWLQCFNTQPHAPHDWVFYYDEPATRHRCPGVVRMPDA